MAQPTRILNCEPSKDTDRDWRLDDLLAADPTQASSAPLPAKHDLREDWWRVGNQLDTGSCVGWACADSVVRWHLVKAGRIESGESLSPRFVWMAAKETDEFTSRPTTFIEHEGTSLKAALDVSRKLGAVRDGVLPFDTGKLYPGRANVFYATAAQLKIESYINLNHDQKRWKYWLVNEGPILTRLQVDATWDAVGADGRLNIYQADTAGGGHAVAIVGYDERGFIVRNSWGTDWADQGFAYASPEYALEAFTEAYGVRVA